MKLQDDFKILKRNYEENNFQDIFGHPMGIYTAESKGRRFRHEERKEGYVWRSL